MNTPERIWATEDAANFGEDKFHTTRPMSGLTEYIRADLCADPALLAEAVEVLRAFADAMKAAQETTGTQTMGMLEAAAFYHLKGGSFHRARAFLSKLENRHDR